MSGFDEHQIRFVANPPPLGRRRVAVVDARANRGGQLGVAADEFEQALELILREGLGGVEVEGAGARRSTQQPLPESAGCSTASSRWPCR